MAKVSSIERFYTTIGMLLHLLFVAGPLDIWYWISCKTKSVKGQTVVITGGASGIGKRLSELFAIELEAKVAILDIDKENAQTTVDKIVECGGTAQSWKCDISQPEEIEKCAKEIDNKFGNVDIVICNAAVLYIGRMLDFKTSDLQRSVNVNIMGTLNTIRAFLKSMEQRNEGQIVAISSIAGFCGETYGTAYCTTKFAIRGVMQCLEMEMKDRGLNGIRCTTVCPYFTRTPMIQKMKMRPTSTWLPYMSIERCAREIIDAILKEKILAFIPHYISIIAQLRGLLSERISNAGREYLNCRYEPLNDEELKIDQISITKKNDYFEQLDDKVKYTTFAIYLLLVTGHFLMEGAVQHIIHAVILFISISNILMAIFALHICDQLHFSFLCTFRWFMQIISFGFLSFIRLYLFQHLSISG
ncbi:unnamed protein product [Thelazia callipaeda]|uniref:Short-chain dehydrogenase/reductase 3 n=1 Tax=Thelazia callipaeda TaxID=103827 RepID=A0A0N5DBU8_THECL|nr:unnamed protein product [Thelazia callipaeda]